MVGRAFILVLSVAALAASAAGGGSGGGEGGARGGGRVQSVDAGGVDAETTEPHPLATRGAAADPRVTARGAMEVLSRNLQLIQRIRAKSPSDTLSTNCVTEKLAEARIGVQIGDQEMARLESGLARHDTAEQAYALHRLQLLVERADTVALAARRCTAQDPGGISATKVEVEISPAIPDEDPTAPPLPPRPEMRPANDGR